MATVSAFIGLLLSISVEPWLENLLASESEHTEPVVSKGKRPDFPESKEELPGIRLINEVAIGPEGQRAHLKITVLDAEHYWPIGRADVVMTPGGQEEDIFEFLDSSGLQKRIEKAQDIVAIGMASCELERLDDQTLEVTRAEARAQQLINWTRRLGTLPSETQLYTVNLGRYQDPACSEKSAYETRLQRNAVLVAVVYKENISNPRELERLLKAELMSNSRVGLEIERYSQTQFELRRHS